VLHEIAILQNKVKESITTRRKVAHDIRGPLGGIVSLAQIIIEQGRQNTMDQVLEFMKMIEKGGNELLEMVGEILSGEKQYVNTSSVMPSADFNFQILKEKLKSLYEPQAFQKGIHFTISLNESDATTPISKHHLLQIAGNLASNAIKFTPANGKVDVTLGFKYSNTGRKTMITVKDNGIGMDNETITKIHNGNGISSKGTEGEEGYGFGLSIVKHLIDKLKGEWKILSIPNEETIFEVLV
jgi:signal transduction histidine kinase